MSLAVCRHNNRPKQDPGSRSHNNGRKQDPGSKRHNNGQKQDPRGESHNHGQKQDLSLRLLTEDIYKTNEDSSDGSQTRTKPRAIYGPTVGALNAESPKIYFSKKRFGREIE